MAAGASSDRCMPTGSDLLESLRVDWVTNARASADYAMCRDSWDMGYSALLHWGVGLAPFKDVMWSTPRQPGSPYANTTLFPSQYAACTEGGGVQRDVRLDSLVSAFSTGPVGLGDGNGLTDASLALSTCRADGLLLQPSKPLSPLDRTFWSAATAAAAAAAAAAGAGAAAAEARAAGKAAMRCRWRLPAGLRFGRLLSGWPTRRAREQ